MSSEGKLVTITYLRVRDSKVRYLSIICKDQGIFNDIGLMLYPMQSWLGNNIRMERSETQAERAQKRALKAVASGRAVRDGGGGHAPSFRDVTQGGAGVGGAYPQEAHQAKMVASLAAAQQLRHFKQAEVRADQRMASFGTQLLADLSFRLGN